jgi:DNA-binding response OmpR family regulator
LPDIAILDIGMPDMSGYDVARSARQSWGKSAYLLDAILADKRSH